MRRTKDELINSAKSIIGESTEDSVISFLEDLADSIETVDVSEYETRISTLEAEKATIETEWRERYISRFGEASTSGETDNVDTVDDSSEDDDVEILDDDEIAELFT